MSFVVRYVWLTGGSASKALLINSKMVRDGYAGYDGSLNSPRYFENIRKAQQSAKENDRGIWGSSGGVHVEAPTFTSEELDYMAWLNAEIDTVDQTFVKFNELGEVITEVQLYDPVWNAEIDAVFAAWELAYQTAETTTPPGYFARLHQL